VAFYIISYALLQAGVLRGSGYLYATFNLIAASLVLISLMDAFNLSAAVIQIFWIVISIIGILRIYFLNHRIRFTEEERRMLDDVLPQMPDGMARRFMNRGVWANMDSGQSLTTESQPVERLSYILSGRANVISGGRTITQLERGFVGEMNVLESGPASATVEIAEPSRVFTVSGDNLRSLSKNDPELRLHLEQWLREAVHQKLLAANQKLTQKPAGPASGEDTDAQHKDQERSQ
jgi:CRP-like cAMP-binding protein